MKTNSRLVLLDFKTKFVYVYEEKRVIQTYKIEGPLSVEDVEEVRTAPETTRA